MSGRVAKISGIAPVSGRRFLHTRRVFQYPAGISVPVGSTRNPAGWPGNRLSVAPLKSQANGDLISLMKPQFGFDLQIELPKRQIKPHRRIAISLRLAGSRTAGFRVDPAGTDIPAGYWKPRRVWGNRRAETGAVPLSPPRLFATRPDFSNPAGYGQAEIHFCPPLALTMLLGFERMTFSPLLF